MDGSETTYIKNDTQQAENIISNPQSGHTTLPLPEWNKIV